MKEKYCHGCMTDLPICEFTPHKAYPDGYRPRCRKCICEYERRRYHIDGRGKAAAAAWRSKNRERHNSYMRDFNAKKRALNPKPIPTPEEVAALAAWRYERKLASRKKTYEKHKIKVLAVAAIYRANHKAEEKINRRAHYVRNKERVAAVAKEYRHNNRPRINQWGAKRKAATIRAIPSWVDFDKVQAFYDLVPLMTEETGAPHEVDHIVPLQGRTVCGLHWHGNLQVIPMSENRSKAHFRWPDMP